MPIPDTDREAAGKNGSVDSAKVPPEEVAKESEVKEKPNEVRFSFHLIVVRRWYL